VRAMCAAAAATGDSCRFRPIGNLDWAVERGQYRDVCGGEQVAELGIAAGARGEGDARVLAPQGVEGRHPHSSLIRRSPPRRRCRRRCLAAPHVARSWAGWARRDGKGAGSMGRGRAGRGGGGASWDRTALGLAGVYTGKWRDPGGDLPGFWNGAGTAGRFAGSGAGVEPGADPVGAGGGEEAVDRRLAVVQGRHELAPPAVGLWNRRG
jgi:hypothetical protein